MWPTLQNVLVNFISRSVNDGCGNGLARVAGTLPNDLMAQAVGGWVLPSVACRSESQHVFDGVPTTVAVGDTCAERREHAACVFDDFSGGHASVRPRCRLDPVQLRRGRGPLSSAASRATTQVVMRSAEQVRGGFVVGIGAVPLKRKCRGAVDVDECQRVSSGAGVRWESERRADPAAAGHPYDASAEPVNLLTADRLRGTCVSFGGSRHTFSVSRRSRSAPCVSVSFRSTFPLLYRRVAVPSINVSLAAVRRFSDSGGRAPHGRAGFTSTVSVGAGSVAELCTHHGPTAESVPLSAQVADPLRPKKGIEAEGSSCETHQGRTGETAAGAGSGTALLLPAASAIDFPAPRRLLCRAQRKRNTQRLLGDPLRSVTTCRGVVSAEGADGDDESFEEWHGDQVDVEFGTFPVTLVSRPSGSPCEPQTSSRIPNPTEWLGMPSTGGAPSYANLLTFEQLEYGDCEAACGGDGDDLLPGLALSGAHEANTCAPSTTQLEGAPRPAVNENGSLSAAGITTRQRVDMPHRALAPSFSTVREPPAPIALTSPSPPLSGAAREVEYVYNIFTNRIVRSDSPIIRSMAVAGIGISPETKQICIVDESRLRHFAARLANKEAVLPSAWNLSMKLQLGGPLSDPQCGDPVSKVRSIIDAKHRLASTRRNRMMVGVIHADGTTGKDIVSAGVEQHSLAGAEGGLRQADARGLQVPPEPVREGPQKVSDLNEEQLRVVQLVLEGYNTYIGGGAGTGKSVLLRFIKRELAKLGLSVAMTATTGLAGCHIGGTTLHHCFGINIHGEFTRRKELLVYDVVIVDEVSMLPRELLEQLDHQMRRAHGVDLPFGGVQVILCGDFMQLGAIASLPVHGSPLFRRSFVMVKLMEVVRQNHDSAFTRQLHQLRRGVVPPDLEDTIQFLRSPTPTEQGATGVHSVAGAVNLFPTNALVAMHNAEELAKLTGEEIVFPAQLTPPALVGKWTPTLLLRVTEVTSSVGKALAAAIERHVLKFFEKHDSSALLPLLGTTHIALYPVFSDGYALRIRVPPDFDAATEEALVDHLRELSTILPALGVGASLKESFPTADGLHTDQDEHLLSLYAERSPMMNSLSLKIGARVMLRTNMSAIHVNGSVGTVVGFSPLKLDTFSPHVLSGARELVVDPYANFLKYEHGFTAAVIPVVDFGDGRPQPIPPTVFYVGGLANTHHYCMGIVAVPLSLAYAFTVHKVQGLTLVGRVHLELSRMWPCEHLLYVAMSRVRNPDQLSVSSFSENLVKAASESLVFDESLPHVGRVRVPEHLVQATWKRSPGRRKLALRAKQLKKKWQKLQHGDALLLGAANTTAKDTMAAAVDISAPAA